MKALQSEIEILASAEQVWQLLTDFTSFPQWNPFIRYINGEAHEGAWLEVYIQPGGTRGMKSRPTILRAKPNQELRWFAYLLMPGLFDGEFSFIIEPLGEDRVRFVQREIFTGLLVPLFARKLTKNTWHGLQEMNQALKLRAEQIR